jgi:hypothetical protein
MQDILKLKVWFESGDGPHKFDNYPDALKSLLLLTLYLGST